MDRGQFAYLVLHTRLLPQLALERLAQQILSLPEPPPPTDEQREAAAAEMARMEREWQESPPDILREMMGTDWFSADDMTDEDGFAAVGALGGFGVLVGYPRLTAAEYGLADPSAVARWLGL